MNILDTFLSKDRANRAHLMGEYVFIKAGPPIVCKDGYSVSVQCSSTAYSLPRETFKDTAKYTSFELGFPDQSDELLDEYAEDSVHLLHTVYPYVPREVVDALIEKHGGLV